MPQRDYVRLMAASGSLLIYAFLLVCCLAIFGFIVYAVLS